MPESAPDGSIIITPKEFYDGVKQDISDIKQAVSPLPQIRADLEDAERRLSRLERVAWVALGVALASGAPQLASFVH